MKYKNLTHKAITTKFSISEYQNIRELAKENECEPSEVIREAWLGYKKRIRLVNELENLKFNLLKQTFEVCSAVADLSEDDRVEAISRLKLRLRNLK